MRIIILHYHLFKNAGTSVDAILKRNFGSKWVTREFPQMKGNNTALVEEWIKQTPEAVAYSSHTMMGPIPQIEGVGIISVMLLRDPIERIKSAYRFERKQQADTWGAKLAKELDFEGYVRTRLALASDRQCRNFQTHRLASLIVGNGTELEKAKQALGEVTVVGLVEAFDETIKKLGTALNGYYPDFHDEAEWTNVTSNSDTLNVSEIEAELRIENKDDIEIVTTVRSNFQ